MKLYKVNGKKVEEFNVLKIIKSFKKEQYLTDYITVYNSAKVVEKDEIGKYYFKSKQEAIEDEIKKQKSYIIESESRIDSLLNQI